MDRLKLYINLPFQGAEEGVCLVPGTLPRAKLNRAFSPYMKTLIHNRILKI